MSASPAPPPDPVAATVRRLWDETPKLKGVVLEVPREIAEQYERPGQYVVLRSRSSEDRDRVFLAIASSPGEAHALELLLGPQAANKLGLRDGETILVEPPSGKGYPIEIAQNRDVLLFAVGSALSSIRSVVEVIRTQRREYGAVTLYVGAHTEAEFPYAGYYDVWRRDRIAIVRAISRPWIQELFAREPASVDNAVAFVCGMKAMTSELKDVLTRAGMNPERIRENW